MKINLKITENGNIFLDNDDGISSDSTLGRVGEHNATVLRFTFFEELNGKFVSDFQKYLVVLFEEGEKSYLIGQNNKFEIPLELTESSELLIRVDLKKDKDVIFKSEPKLFTFADSDIVPPSVPKKHPLVGELEKLLTKNKENLVEAINEVLSSVGVSGKGIKSVYREDFSEDDGGFGTGTLTDSLIIEYTDDTKSAIPLPGIFKQELTVKETADGIVINLLDADGSIKLFEIKNGARGPKGEKGENYVLTDADKTDIAEQAVELIDIPEVSNITPEQTTFFEFEPLSNLLDVSTVKVGLLDTTDKIYTAEQSASYGAYRYFEQYIPVDEGDVLNVQFTDKTGTRKSTVTANTGISRVIAYDSNKQVLTSLGVKTTSANKVVEYTVPATVKYIRISLSSDYDKWTDVALVKNAIGVIPYEEYGTSGKPYLNPEYLKEEKKGILAFLPDEIVCAVGRTIEIYNKQVCPIAEKYHFRWVCNVGKALERKFSITGTESLIGDYDLMLEIYDDAETCVFSKSITLIIVANTLTDNISICPIGDSLTNGKYWLNEVQVLSDNKVSFVGTRGTTEGRKHEGRSGFTSTGYLTAHDYDFENEGVHPFWDSTNNQFSWEYYKTNSGVNPTAVQIFLGTNDLFGNTTPEEFSANIKVMVDNIRSSDATMPVFVVLTILTGGQNGLGKQQSTDGFAAYKGKYKYGLDCKFIKAMNLLYNTLKDYENLYFVPLAECHDNEYNFGSVETAVNPRASQKECMPNEGIHPQQQGYEQMADVMYSVYCRAFAT